MYQLVSAIGKNRKVGGRWSNINIGPMPMAELYEKYETVHAILSNPFYTGNRSLNLNDLRATYGGSLITFSDMLSLQADNTLPASTQIPAIRTKKVIYSDAVQAQYQIRPAAPFQSPDNTATPADKTWLTMTRPDPNYALFQKSCLVTVNGFVHLTDADNNRIYVVDGQKTARNSGKATCGILSFREVGELEFVPITDSMIFRRYADTPFKNQMYIDVGVVRPNKAAMLVLGGYLHVLDSDTFYRVNDTTFAVSFENIPLLDRYFDSVQHLDLSSLGLTNAPGNPVEIDAVQLYSDAALRKYACLSQSFIVFVDNPSLFVETESIRESTNPQVAISFKPPHQPAITETGKIVDYWRHEEHNQWVLAFQDAQRNNYNFNETTKKFRRGVDDHRLPYQQVIRPRLRFWHIGTDIEYFIGV